MACHFEILGTVLKHEGYLTLIRAKLIRHFVGNIIKTKNDVFKPNIDNYRKKGKKVKV